MYIASGGTNKIVKATLDVTSVGEKGSGELQFNHLIGLHFGIDKLLYVADCENKVLRSDLSFVRSIIVKCQSTLYCDSTGNVHIGTIQGIIEIFSSVGHYYIGQYSSGIVQDVGDVAFMGNGDCVVSNHVTDNKGDGIFVFNGTDRTLLHSFGDKHHPYGIFKDQAGYIYVTEWDGSRVLKY